MNRKLIELVSRLKGNPPATEEAILDFERSAGLNLPPDYRAFLRQADGAEGFVGEGGYVILWPVEKLLEWNEAYEVEEYAPGLVLFGSSGGGEAYAFDSREGQMDVVAVPFVGMDLSEVARISMTFAEFLEALSEGTKP
ncbi:MAG: SMI1/KNR4 family protein [Acidobacteria bacterium]|nr:MAG: SMI1/KNR4 family protein [Acidobacteriota bacterium]